MATESKPENEGDAIAVLIERVADQLEARTGRRIKIVPLGSDGWMPLRSSASEFQWYFRKERKCEPRVYTACQAHGELLRRHGFRRGKPTRVERPEPESCVICDGGIFEREIETCTCVRAPRRCPVVHHRWHH